MAAADVIAPLARLDEAPLLRVPFDQTAQLRVAALVRDVDGAERMLRLQGDGECRALIH